ncbi:hypothetical protein AQ860_27710 [Burkholderia pseudomallei]|nr:hypothetical protein AQ760_00105 [Burkholderia pseudomallei]OMZ20901.1 hypothetical protein AQ859_04945 [Burkholderia pseudomallei]OMZ25342.1 hypothetical protein AQ860_27710 [Burkholderia pseudomallei]
MRRAVSANAERRHARRLARRASQRGAARHGTARHGNVEMRGDDQFIASARFRRSTRAAPVPDARHAARPRCNAPRHSWQARCVAS